MTDATNDYKGIRLPKVERGFRQIDTVGIKAGIFESTLNEKSSPDRKVYFLNNNDRAEIFRPLAVDLKKRDLKGLHLIGQKRQG